MAAMAKARHNAEKAEEDLQNAVEEYDQVSKELSGIVGQSSRSRSSLQNKEYIAKLTKVQKRYGVAWKNLDNARRNARLAQLRLKREISQSTPRNSRRVSRSTHRPRVPTKVSTRVSTSSQDPDIQAAKQLQKLQAQRHKRQMLNIKKAKKIQHKNAGAKARRQIKEELAAQKALYKADLLSGTPGKHKLKDVISREEAKADAMSRKNERLIAALERGDMLRVGKQPSRRRNVDLLSLEECIRCLDRTDLDSPDAMDVLAYCGNCLLAAYEVGEQKFANMIEENIAHYKEVIRGKRW